MFSNQYKQQKDIFKSGWKNNEENSEIYDSIKVRTIEGLKMEIDIFITY